MTNESLIRRLVADARPVRRWGAPGLRWACWLAPTLLLLIAATCLLGVREDLAQRGREPAFLLDVLGLLLLGMVSARSAFRLSVPMLQSATTWGLPLTGALLWLVLLSARALGAGIFDAGPGQACVLRITGLGMLPLLLGCRMQRRATPLEPAWTGLFLALASFAFAALASRAWCARDGAAHLLLWHCLPVFVLTGVAAATARHGLSTARTSTEH